jgi:mono/diheme cytochrome c family protein
MQLRLIVIALSAVALPAVIARGAASAPQYNRDIKPILADHCLTCHGQDEQARKSKLRLDTREGSLKGGKSGVAAIVPGKPEESELIARITTHDEDDVMPPPEAKKPLTPEQIEALKKWIQSGAEYQGHWAFIAPVKAEVPRVGRAGKKANAIDAFVLARLQKEKLKASPEARPEILLRRVYLDIVGLPPAPAEIDSFRGRDRSVACFAAIRGEVGALVARRGALCGQRWLRERPAARAMDLARLGHRRASA